MSFKIELYKNSSPRNSFYPTLSKVRDVEGELRDQCSVLEPKILMRINDVGDLKNVNYMHIGEFGRYYYITDIISVRNTLIEVSGHVDVLSTYRTQILGNDAIIARSGIKGNYNTYLQDSELATYQDSYVCNYRFPQNFKHDNDNLILAVAGAAQS